MNRNAMLAAILALACLACTPTATPPAAVDAVKEVAAADAATSDTASTQEVTAGPLQPADLHALGLASQLRAVSAKQGDALWPGFRLHEKPLYLIYRNAKAKGVRGFLLGFAKVPAGALPVTAAELGPLASLGVPVYRYDVAVNLLSVGWTADGYTQIAGEIAVVAAYTDASKADDKAWARDLFTAYFQRLRMMDAEWKPVIGCGDPNKWSAHPEAATLMFVEAALVRDALAATDLALAKTLVLEFQAVRAWAMGLDPMVARIFNDAENDPGAEFFVVRNALIAAGFLTPAEVAAHDQAELAKAFLLPMAEFPDFINFYRGGETGAALLQLALRFGWTVEPTYRAGESFVHLIETHLGPSPPGALESAKKRYDYKAFEAKAKQAVAVKLAALP